MNKIMLSALHFTILWHAITAATSNTGAKKAHIDRFLENLEENNKAYIEHQKTRSDVTYTTFYQANRVLTVETFLSLYRTLYGKTKRIKRLTIITIGLRSGYRIDNADINQVNLITAMQKLLTAETESTVVSNNLIVTVNHIEKDRIPDFDSLSTTNNTIKSIYSKLICLFVNSITEILCELFKQKSISIFYRFSHDLASKHIEHENVESLEDNFDKMYDHIISDFRCDFERVLTGYFVSVGIHDWKMVFDSLHTKVLEYEQEIKFKYFTDKITDLNKAIKFMFDHLYKEVLRDTMIAIFPTGINYVVTNNEKLKVAFIRGCREIIKYIRRTRDDVTLPDDLIDQNLVLENGYAKHRRIFENHYYDYFKIINFDRIKVKLPKTHAERFQKLSQELDLPYTRIIISRKLTIKNLPLLIDILRESKVLENLHKNQTLYIEINRVIEDSIRLIGDRKYRKKSFDLSNGYKYAVSEDETIKVYSKTKNLQSKMRNSASSKCTNSVQQRLSRNCTEENEMDDARNKISIVAFTKQTLAVTAQSTISLLVKKIMKVNNSKFGSLHELTVKCESKNTQIYIFHHTSDDSKTERITVVFCETQKKIVLCLDNVPLSILDELSISLCVLRHTNAPTFTMPNVWKTKVYQIFSTEQTISVPQLIDKMFYTYRHYFQRQFADNMSNTPIRIKMHNLLDYYKYGYYSDANLKNFISYKLCLKETDFDQIIRKFVFGMDPFDKQLTDPLVTDNHRTSELVKLFAMRPDYQTTILYIIVWKENDLPDMFNDNTIIFEKLLEREKRFSEFIDFTEIEQSLGLDKKLFTSILIELTKLKFFDSVVDYCKITPQSYKLDLMERLDTLIDMNIQRGQNNENNSSKTPQKSMFAMVLKHLVEPKIDKFLTLIFKEKRKLMPNKRVKVTCLHIENKYKTSKFEFIEGLKNVHNVEYRNLEHLDITLGVIKDLRKKAKFCTIS